MHIGFDAKRAFQNFTGLGNYSRTLLQSLATLYPENDYHLYTPKQSTNKRVEVFLSSGNFKIHTPKGILKFLGGFWRTFVIGFILNPRKIQLYHGLSHELPFFISPQINTVVTIHDLIQLRYPAQYKQLDRQIFTLKSKYACRRADIIVAISEQTKQDIIDFYKMDAQKIKVIYQTCHEQYRNKEVGDFRQISEKYSFPKRYILYVGTISERKNAMTLVKAFEKILDATDTDLVIVGSGDAYFQKVKKYVETKRLTSRIHLKAIVDFADMPTVYSHAEIFVHPSVFEGFGIPIIEAQYCGVPVICSEGSCFPEAAGAHSKYVEPYNVEMWAQAILELLDNPEEQKRMAKAGLQYVQKFNPEVVTKAMAIALLFFNFRELTINH